MRLKSESKFASIGVKYQKEKSFTTRLDERCRLRQHTLDVGIAAKLYLAKAHTAPTAKRNSYSEASASNFPKVMAARSAASIRLSLPNNVTESCVLGDSMPPRLLAV